MFEPSSKYRILLFGLIILFVVILSPSAAKATQPDQDIRGFRSLNGADAAAFKMPSDIELVTQFDTATGLTYERYQQFFGDLDARVLGGQLTLYRDDSGDIAIVIGAHYPDLVATNNVNLSAVAARGIVTGDIGVAGQRLVDLMIDPDTGHYFYQVETRREESRWIHWINADNSRVFNKFNALAYECGSLAVPCGFGVQYSEDNDDVKDLAGLTTLSGGNYLLLSADGRQETHDQGSTRRPFLGPIATDGDDSWVLLGDKSPGQQALVDSHYYANVTDNYYGVVHGYDWVAAATAAGANDRMVIHAHYSAGYNNAFWNGTYIALGDGDQINFEELTALDVIGHELTHGVTDFTSDLIYQNESGALNESFSDIMGSSMEWWAEINGKEPAASLAPDWLIGEDFDLRGDTVPGFRNMMNPGEDGDPSHYDDRYTGTSDNGGVHTNSGIPNHWFYLLVNGGQNATIGRASGTDVQGIGLTAAETIAFLGFTALPANASFCDARAGTIAVAGANNASVADAWDEVGVTEALCTGGGNSSPTADFTFTTSGLTADFTDASSDTDGTIVSWDWDFGDGNTSTEQNPPPYTYTAEGTYNVMLIVQDDSGATDSITKDVTVHDSSSGGDFTLAVDAYKVKGTQYADLGWSGATSSDVDVYRDSSNIMTTTNDGAYTDTTGQKGGGSVTYQVCEAGTATCSNEVLIIW